MTARGAARPDGTGTESPMNQLMTFDENSVQGEKPKAVSLPAPNLSSVSKRCAHYKR